jgi:hypothetical protein
LQGSSIVSVLQAYRDALPAACAVQRAQVEDRLAALAAQVESQQREAQLETALALQAREQRDADALIGIRLLLQSAALQQAAIAAGAEGIWMAPNCDRRSWLRGEVGPIRLHVADGYLFAEGGAHYITRVQGASIHVNGDTFTVSGGRLSRHIAGRQVTFRRCTDQELEFYEMSRGAQAVSTTASQDEQLRDSVVRALAIANLEIDRGHERIEERVTLIQLHRDQQRAILLEAGYQYTILGACSTNCTDVNLAMFGPDAELLAHDVELNNRPRITVTPQATAYHALRISLETCEAAQCHVGVRMLRRSV